MIVAIAGAVTSYFAWRASVNSKKVDRKTETNHGRTPGEYLEMVLEVKDGVLDLKQSFVDVKGQVVNLHEQLSAHTEQDARNFEDLATLVKGNATLIQEHDG